MGILNPLKKVASKLKSVGGKVADKLPAPGHTIIGDALAKRRAKKLPMPPGTRPTIPPVTSITNLVKPGDIRPVGRVNLPKGNQFKL